MSRVSYIVNIMDLCPTTDWSFEDERVHLILIGSGSLYFSPQFFTGIFNWSVFFRPILSHPLALLSWRITCQPTGGYWITISQFRIRDITCCVTPIANYFFPTLELLPDSQCLDSFNIILSLNLADLYLSVKFDCHCSSSPHSYGATLPKHRRTPNTFLVKVFIFTIISTLASIMSHTCGDTRLGYNPSGSF